MKVLIIEDDPVQRHFYSTQLTRRGHVVVSPDGTDERDLGRDGLLFGLDEKSEIDIAIVDHLLGEKSRLSGADIIREWRGAGRCFPVMLLTATGREHRVRALECGADTFVEKPLKPRELLAEFNALVLRPGSGHRKPDFRRTLPPFELDLANMTVTRQGEPVKLTRTEYKLAELFMTRPGRIIETAHLEEMIETWSGKELRSPHRSVRVHLHNLRRKLDPDGSIGPIETLTGTGYRFRPPGRSG